MPLMPSPGRLKTVSTPQSMRRSTSTSATVLAISVLPKAVSGSRGNPPGERRGLDDDRHVGLDDAGIIGVARNGFGILEIVEPHMPRTACRHHDSIRAHRFAVGIEDRDLNLGVTV